MPPPKSTQLQGWICRAWGGGGLWYKWRYICFRLGFLSTCSCYRNLHWPRQPCPAPARQGHSYTWPFSTAASGDYVECVRAVTLAVLSWGPLIFLNVQVGQGQQAVVPVFTRGEVELGWGYGNSAPRLLWLLFMFMFMLRLLSSVLGATHRRWCSCSGTWRAWAVHSIYSWL